MVLRSSGSSLTEGSIWKSMLLFALPVFLGNVFQQLYNTFDSWVVGNYLGDNALAAVSSSGSLIFMMIGFFNGVAMGAGVIIARCYGARDYDSMRRAIHTDVAFGLTAGILLTALGVALHADDPSLDGHPGGRTAPVHFLFPLLFLRSHFHGHV